MKHTLKVRLAQPNCRLEVLEQGDWIDMRVAETTAFKAPLSDTLKRKIVDGKEVKMREVKYDLQLLSLGVAIKLPAGYEAYILPRSSTPSKFGIMCANSKGVIDNSYCGDDDIWKFPAIAIRNTKILAGSRICQFRIQLKQNASLWQKFKHLFYSGVKIEYVDSLNGTNRGGIGSTGVN